MDFCFVLFVCLRQCPQILCDLISSDFHVRIMLEFLVVSYFFYNRQFIYFNTMMLLGGRSTPRLQSSEPLLEGIVYMRQVWTLKWYFFWRPICRLKSLRSQWVCCSFLNFLFIFVFIFCFMVCLFEVVSS